MIVKRRVLRVIFVLVVSLAILEISRRILRSSCCPTIIDRAFSTIGLKYMRCNSVITQYEMMSTSSCNRPSCALNWTSSAVKIIPTPEVERCERVRDCVTVTIKTRHRLNLVCNLITSVLLYYPGTRFVVADEIYTEYDHKTLPKAWTVLYDSLPEGQVTYIQNPPGVGLGRKSATRLARTKYVLVADDDFLFTADTNIMTLVRALDRTDLTIASGAVDDWTVFDGLFRKERQHADLAAHLVFYPNVFYEYLGIDIGCYACDITKNFFLAKRHSILDKGSWDETRLFFEHEDFFLNMKKNGAKIAYCPEVVVHHDMRNRGLSQYRKLHYAKWTNHLQQKWQFDEIYFCFCPLSYLETNYCSRQHQVDFGK